MQRQDVNKSRIYIILIGLLLISQAGCGAVVKKTPMQKVGNGPYCWTPDGKIAFYRLIDHWIKMEPDPVPGGGGVYEDYEKDDEAFIVVRDPETKEEKVLFKIPYGHTALHVSWMDWSVANNEILLTVLGSAIYVINTDGKILQRIISSKEAAGFKQAQWSPDGKNIICIASHECKPGIKSEECIGIYILDIDGKNPRRIVFNADAFSISPDGKQIAYQTIPRRATEEDFKRLGVDYLYTTQDIYIVNADGTGKRLLVEGGENPIWSPDGKWILYHRVFSGCFIISTDGKEKKKVNGYGIWSRDGKSILDNGYIWQLSIIENEKVIDKR